MRYDDFVAGIRRFAGLAEVGEYGSVRENGRDYPLLRMVTPGTKRMVLTTGFHGEEPAGPLSILEHFEALAAHAKARDVGLRVYPCINPSGFEAGHRYNASGEPQNNDFMRYEVTPGVVKGELLPGEPFLRWWLHDAGPKETILLRHDLKGEPTPHAALDLHQDAWVRPRCQYAYIFGPTAAFCRLASASVAHAKVACHVQVHDQRRTDRCGFIVDHDGSITDWYHRRGTPWTAALETSTVTPLGSAMAVNLVWARGFIDLAASETSDPL